MNNSNGSKVYIAGMGMVSPVGFDLETTAAAVKAGISRLQESEYYSKLGKPFTMALIPEEALPEITYKLNNEENTTLQMGIMLMATDIAMKQITVCQSSDKDIPVFFSGPEVYQKRPASVSSKFIEYLMLQTGAKINKAASKLSGIGRAGVIDAVDLAIRYLHQVDSDYVLVGGAESFQDQDLLAFLDADDRLLSEEVMNGFAPGEGAGFLLLTKDINKALKRNSGVISLSEPGIAHENGHMYSEAPYSGDGLSEAFKKSLVGYQGHKISKIYSSMNGEQFWAKEYAVAAGRSSEYIDENVELLHPADCFGDMGAAAGALLIGLASDSLYKEGRQNTNLVYCSSDQSYRAAICVNFEPLSVGA